MEEGMVPVVKFSGGSQAYFLTHLHQDHTVAAWSRIGGRVAPWAYGSLYCSPTTVRLLPPPHPLPAFPGIEASLRPLAPYVTPPDSLASLFSLHDWRGTTDFRLVSVAGASLHAGSLMYLFLGDLGCMLYTGCFRWELGSDKARRAKQALLDELGGDTIIDVLYLEFWTTPIVAEQVNFT
jgi:DNA cross-link repair 1B protein